MKEAIEAMSGGVGRFVQSYLLPSLIAVGLAAFFLFPTIRNRGIFADIAELGFGERVALIGLVTVVVSLLLASAATPLYRVLEGYRLPGSYAEHKRAEHRAKRKALRAQVPSVREEPIKRGSLREALDRYPRSAEEVMPTRLGNALRAGESYGREQYGLDTVLLWNQLLSVARDELKEGLTRTRTMMDFYAGAFWLSPVFALASAGTAWYGSSPIHLIGVAAVLICPLAYAGAVRSATLYAAVLRALVDTSRLDLATRLGLALPMTLKEEQAMWSAISDFYAWGHQWTNASEWVSTIDAARRVDPKSDTSGQTATDV